MSIANLITQGIGDWSSIEFVVRDGYEAGEDLEVATTLRLITIYSSGRNILIGADAREILLTKSRSTMVR